MRGLMDRHDAFERELGVDTPLSQLLLRAFTALAVLAFNLAIFTGLWQPESLAVEIAAPLGLAVALGRLAVAVRPWRAERRERAGLR